MPELKEVFEMTTKQVEPDVDAWREQEGRQLKSTRNKKIWALAVAAAIGLAAVGLILGTLVRHHARTPANQPPTTSPAAMSAAQVATGFLQAYGAFDADRAITYLADDADLLPLGVHGTREFRLLLSFLGAQGFKQIRTFCEETSRSVFGTEVRCTFDFHAIRSDEIGKGPYSGSYFDLSVRDGRIVRATEYLEISEFSPQMWEPFANWVSTKYAKDAAVMYNETLTDYRLTARSIRLWKQHTREYVKAVGR
jgi:hypothetical protein